MHVFRGMLGPGFTKLPSASGVMEPTVKIVLTLRKLRRESNSKSMALIFFGDMKLLFGCQVGIWEMGDAKPNIPPY